MKRIHAEQHSCYEAEYMRGSIFKRIPEAQKRNETVLELRFGRSPSCLRFSHACLTSTNEIKAQTHVARALAGVSDARRLQYKRERNMIF